MIEKIIKIFGIGRFESYISEGDVSFKKLTLIYGENGRGKTTLSAIFRSLRSNDPMHILERLTLGRKDDSSIDIKTDGKNQIFENKNWTLLFLALIWGLISQIHLASIQIILISLNQVALLLRDEKLHVHPPGAQRCRRSSSRSLHPLDRHKLRQDR